MALDWRWKGPACRAAGVPARLATVADSLVRSASIKARQAGVQRVDLVAVVADLCVDVIGGIAVVVQRGSDGVGLVDERPGGGDGRLRGRGCQRGGVERDRSVKARSAERADAVGSPDLVTDDGDSAERAVAAAYIADQRLAVVLRVLDVAFQASPSWTDTGPDTASAHCPEPCCRPA